MGKLVTFTRPIQSSISTGFAINNRCSQNIVLLCMVAYAVIVSMYAFVYPSSLSGKSYVLTGIAIIPIIIGMMYSNSITPFGALSEKTIAVWVVALIVIIYLGIMSYSTPMNMQIVSVSALGINIIVVGIALISAAAMFTIFSNYLRTLQNMPNVGIFFRILFFIPCLISDTITAMKTQFQMTTRPIIILLIVDIILILLYGATPYILRYISRKYGRTTILESVSYLDQTNVLLKNLTSIRYVDTHAIHTDDSSTPIYKIRDVYAIGFWVFITPVQSIGGKTINIFKFGDDSSTTSKTSCVNMVYNSSTGLYEVNLAPYKVGTTTKYVLPQTISHTEIIPQAWNYIVFNYTEVSAEIFVNGVISRAITFGSSIVSGETPGYIRPTYYETDRLVIGEDKGLYGAIYNLIYYPTSLDASQIAAAYAYARLFSLPEIPI